MKQINNTRIVHSQKLISPQKIREEIPISNEAVVTIADGREEVVNHLNGKDDRFLIITGPCSIHDVDLAMDYAKKLKVLREKHKDKLNIIMRLYFEKPRTTTGWKGLVNDPFIDESNDIEKGLKIARKLLIDIAEMGIPVATEILDPIIAAYIGELVSWVAIGARTTESQTHRQMASGISAPIGMKNGTDGSIDNAINAMISSKAEHSFVGVDDAGKCCILQTMGNNDSHIVLRGGKNGVNFHTEDIMECEEKLKKVNLLEKILVDCSHANSKKDYKKQRLVVNAILAQKKAGNKSIFGIMLESNINEGRQDICKDISSLKYGVSLTDSCIGWEETEEILEVVYEKL